MDPMPNQSQQPPGASSPEPPRSPNFEQRVEQFGRDAEEAGKRLAANPVVVQAADTAARVWGLLLIAVGGWFFAEVTLGYDMPAIPWREVWPLGLIVIGLVVIVRGLTRRGA